MHFTPFARGVPLFPAHILLQQCIVIAVVFHNHTLMLSLTVMFVPVIQACLFKSIFIYSFFIFFGEEIWFLGGLQFFN